MAIPILITKQVAQKFVQIADGLSDDQFNRYAIKAQEFDFKELVTDTFYYELMKKKADPLWSILFDEGEFEIDGTTYYHQGINAVLSYFTYARLLLSENVVSTSHGIVTKKSSVSEPVSYTLLKDQSRDAIISANKAFETVIVFIRQNQDTYASFFNSYCGVEARPSDIKIKVLQ